HGEDDVAIGEIRWPVDEADAALGQRLRLGAGAVVEGDVAAILGKPLRHRRTHPARANPADLVRLQICCHVHCLLDGVVAASAGYCLNVCVTAPPTAVRAPSTTHCAPLTLAA